MLWIGLAWAAKEHPDIAGSLIGAGVGATVSVAVLLASRLQARRQTALDLFKEYYSADFAASRRKAEAFMRKHRGVDWSCNDPYALGKGDPDLEGYGAVLRYWQRVATYHREGEVDRGLTQRLLSRELGFWRVRILDPMADRKGMYVRDQIVELARLAAIGEGRDAFEAGVRDGRRSTPPELAGTASATALPTSTPSPV